MKKIIFVDDDVHLINGLQRSLRYCSDDWEMVFFNHPRNALDYLSENTIDVIVADMCMPEISGLELVKRLKKRTNDFRGIFLTGTADLQSAILSINHANVFKFYTKPCSCSDLYKGIDEALADLEVSKKASTINMALNYIPVGVCIVSPTGNLLYCNQEADRIFTQKDGIYVNHQNCLKAERREISNQLLDTIKTVTFVEEGEVNDALSLPRKKGERALSLRCMRLNPNRNEEILIFVSDPDFAPQIDPSIISRIFCLTNSEAKLAAELAKGYSLENAAKNIGLTVSTARTYLKQVFLKTQTNRQAELIRLILMSPAIMATFTKQL